MRHYRSLLRGALAASLVLAAACGDSPTTTEPTPDPIPNFIRLQSDPGDYIGGGRSYEYTHANALIEAQVGGGYFSISIEGDENWRGEFQLPAGQTQLRVGTYSGMTRYPFHDAARGGLSWSGEGRGCNTLVGTVTVDSVTYSSGALTSIDMRFEQHCEGGAAALRGTIHLRTDDTTAHPGPVNPAPAGLWAPPAGSTPGTGNFIYLASDAGDFIGQGQTNTYTTGISVAANGSVLHVAGGGWNGEFAGMLGLTRLLPGYYGSLERYPFHNPIKGGLSWSGNGRGCNTLTGWFVVDRVVYVGNTLTELDLRFEQHCEGGTPALRGAVRWRG